MIFDYGFSIIGKSHIANNTCCQDSYLIKKLENGWYIAAVADGVGSAKNSQIGSKIAVETAVNFCAEYMPWDYNLISIKSMLRTAYNYAFKQILRESQKSGNPIESYDTTLSLVIYDKKRIIYGHSGDGAIIGLTTFGDFVEITKAQKGQDGISVIPLRGGYTSWVIDTYEEDLVSVMLMTDGVFDTICPYLLKDAENKINKVYTPLGSFFADPKAIGKLALEQDELKAEIKSFLSAKNDYKSELFYKRLKAIYKEHVGQKADEIINKIKEKNYPIALMQSQQDDKTMVALINTEVLLDDKDIEFYSEPDWATLQDAWNRKAYPHMFKEEKTADLKSEKDLENNTYKFSGITSSLI